MESIYLCIICKTFSYNVYAKKKKEDTYKNKPNWIPG